MRSRNRVRNNLYVCPYCFDTFYVEVRSEYRFVFNEMVFCREKCMNNYKLERLIEKRVFGKEINNGK